MSIGSAAVVAQPTRILLIEEGDARDVELALVGLERANFDLDLTRVVQRKDLLEALQHKEFDIVLCDFQLAGFSGVEALDMIRARWPEVPFIFVSGVLGEENAVEMLRRGATDYIVKQRLERLPIAVQRALTEAQDRCGRRVAERSLREREVQFAKLVDSLKDYSVALLSREGLIESWNTASQTIFGYTASEMLGRSAGILFPVNDSESPFNYELQRATLSGSNGIERWLVRKDGTPFHASIVITVIRDAGNALIGFSHIVRDTTDSRVAADLLRQTKEQAENANTAKDQFLAVLSHELRTPLNPIALAAKYLEMLEDLPAAAHESIDIIKRNIRIETRLIDDLLDISRIVNDKLTLNFSRVDIRALIRHVIDGFSAEAEERGIRLELIDDGMPCAVDGDAERLQQIIWNLLKNALKFTSAGGRVAVSILHRDSHVDIEVRDDGIGIAAEEFKRIFRAFEQGQSSEGCTRGGLGLGLAIAHTLAEKHRGKLAVHSDGPGCGACFVLTLECHPDAVATVAQELSAAIVPDDVALRILLVEDDSDTLQAEQRLLTAMGYDVIGAASVAAAAKRLEETRFDVLLSDIGLPDGSGIDVLELFQRHGGGYAIALTGYGMESDQERLRAAGFAQHLVKPLAPDYLLGLLQAVSNGKTMTSPR